MALNIFQHWTRVVLLGTAKSSWLGIEIADKHDIVRKIVDSFKQPKILFSIWVVNGSQNEVLVVRKINVDYQGFLIGYDIEAYVTVLFIDNFAMQFEEGNSISGTSWTIIFFVS